MPPHPPPCHAGEILWGNVCLPRPNSIRIVNTGDSFTFVLNGVSGDLLPNLAESAGDQAHVQVKKTSPGFNVTITSVPHGDASDLVKRLQPDDPKLPD
ncbi:hypothetical protein [Bradyrhizobium sp. Ce-3]|uniref:hypothetical protein n=1 Tax=Bradyrhizobium sp. Ce-3 TaxID=2913970 RepID=UPI001FBBC5C0|nr:hypothetical protein [Bradyrhizobium sp. Ce-3]GKQ50431.1 hypothetical protein BRSPCE3_12860 [Bradyrhizobium sp. Ce-3]